MQGPRTRSLPGTELLLGLLIAGGSVQAARSATRSASALRPVNSTTNQARTNPSEPTNETNWGRFGAPARPNATTLLAQNPRSASPAGPPPIPPPEPSPADVPGGEDAAQIRAALARRQAWNRPRAHLQAPPPGKGKSPAPAAGRTASPKPLPIPAEAPPRIVATRPEPIGPPPAEPESVHEDLIRAALRSRGTPYVWGGASRGGFDCSGFVCYLFRKHRGMNLPHSASAQSRLGTYIARQELLPGDLVFFSTYRRGISHVGIYIGDNRFVHAANRRKDTRIDSLTGYYDRRYRTARRILATPLRFTPGELDELTRNQSQLP